MLKEKYGVILFPILWFVGSLMWFVLLCLGAVSLVTAYAFINWDVNIIAEAFSTWSWEWVRVLWIASSIPGLASVVTFSLKEQEE